MPNTHHPLRTLHKSLDLVDAVAPLLAPIGRHDASLKRQLRRAAQSIALNLAEASGHRDGNRRLRLDTALGSTYETRTAIHIAARWGYISEDAAQHALKPQREVGGTWVISL